MDITVYFAKKKQKNFADVSTSSKVLHYPRVRYETSTLTNYKGLEMMCMVAVLLAALLGSSVLASNQNGKNL